MSLFTDELKVKAQELEFDAASTVGQFTKKKKIALIILLVLIIPVYYGSRYAAQNYWSKQYLGYLIATKPSITDTQDIVVKQIDVLPTGTDTYSAYAYVANPNLELSVKGALYTFTFYDSSNRIVGTDTGQFFMLPNEKKYLVAPRVASQSIVSKATIAFKGVAWQKKTNVPSVKLSVPDPTTYDQFDPPTLTADGSVVNNSPYDLGQVRLVFVLYSKQNKILAVTQRIESTIRSGERRAYKQLWPNLQSINVAQVQVTAETNTLDASNVTPPAPQLLPSGNASDLAPPKKNNQQ